MDKGLNALMHKDAGVAFGVIGYPDGKNKFGNETVYFWTLNQTSTMVLPQTSTTTGMVGMTPVYGTTSYNQAVPLNCNCLIKLIANENNVLIRYEWRGNNCGCRSYNDRLGRYYEQTQEE